MDPRPWPADTLDRMWRAPLLVRERLRRSTSALAFAGVPYAVIGANAVAFWVETVDEGAVRNTPNVDLLIDLSTHGRAAVLALIGAGFHVLPKDSRPAVFLDGPDGTRRSAVQVWQVGDAIGQAVDPLPEVADSVAGPRFQVVTLPILVRMKLSANRTVDKVHLIDMIRVGLIDATWPDKYPPLLANRLRGLIADPEAGPGIHP